MLGDQGLHGPLDGQPGAGGPQRMVGLAGRAIASRGAGSRPGARPVLRWAGIEVALMAVTLGLAD